MSGRRQSQIFTFGDTLPSLVKDRLRDVDAVSTDNVFGQVRGLFRLRLGPSYSSRVAAGWSEEALLLRETYFRRALDAFVLHIVDAWFFEPWEPKVLVTDVARAPHSHNANERGDHKPVGSKTVASAHVFVGPLFKNEGGTRVDSAFLKNVCVWKVGCQNQGQCLPCGDLLQEADCEHLLCVRAPGRILDLVSVNRWHDLVLLARWTAHIPRLHNLLSASWVQTSVGRHEALTAAPLTADMTAEIIKEFRGIAAEAMLHVVDPERAEGMQARMERCLRALQEHQAALAPPKLRTQQILPKAFVNQIFASLDLRNRATLRAHARKFIACLPDDQQASLSPWMDQNIVSGSSLQRGRVYLDLAITLFTRRFRSASEKVLTFAWVDATQKKGFEIFNARTKTFPAERAEDILNAWRFLVMHPYKDDSDPELSSVRRQHSQLLFDNIFFHTQVPQCLGQGRTTLLDRISAWVHSSLLEASTSEGLSEFFSSVVAICTDMGVESHIPEAQLSLPETSLPRFARPARMITAFEDGDYAEDTVATQDLTTSERFLSRCLHIPGTCHAIHNATKDLDGCFQKFADWYQQVKVMNDLIGVVSRRERFVENCLSSQTHPFGKELFEKFAPRLYEDRWAEFTMFLQDGLPLVEFLRGHWDEVRYSRGAVGESKSADGFEPHSITEVLQDPLFIPYWKLQLKLRAGLHDLLRWCEGCSCHYPLVKEKTSYKQQQALRIEIECPPDVPCRCPLAGCRGPELACGYVHRYLESCYPEMVPDELVEAMRELSVEEKVPLLADWEKGRAFIRKDLLARFRHWQELPWVILGGAHPNMTEARVALQIATAKYGSIPDSEKSKAHPWVLQLFAVEPLSGELAGFIEGDQDLSAYPELMAFLARVAFVPTAERIIEAAHRQMKSTTRSKTSLNAMSLDLRIPEVHQILSHNPLAFASLLDAFSETRHIRAFPTIFSGHSCHPEWQQQPKNAQTSRLVAAVARILYRDAAMQHASLRDAAREHRRKKKGKERAIMALSYNNILAVALTAHVREECTSDPTLVVATNHGEFWSATMLHPSRIVSPRLHPGAWEIKTYDMWGVSLSNCGSAEEPVVSAVRQGEDALLNFMHVLEQDAIDEVLQRSKFFVPSQTLVYSLPVQGLTHRGSQKLVASLLEARAFSGGAGCHYPTSAFEIWMLEEMQKQGFADRLNSGAWKLTGKAVDMIQYLHRLESCRPFSECRAVPEDQWTTFELMVQLHQQGWTWQKLPKKRKELSFTIPNGEKIWYSSGFHVSSRYLLCLVRAQTLAEMHNVSFIPHGEHDDVYKAMLGGAAPAIAMAQAAPQRQKKQRRQVKILDPDVAELDDSEEGSQCWGFGDDEEKVLRENGRADAGGGSDASMSGAEVAETPRMSLPSTPAPPSSNHDVSVSAPQPLEKMEEEECPQETMESNSETILDALLADQVGQWMDFRFSRKAASSAPPHGGVEARCRWHARSLVTGCKRYLPFPSSERDGQLRTIRMLQHWCNQAPKFTFQRTHVRMPLPPGSIPNSDLIHLQRPPSPAPLRVITDEQKDLERVGNDPQQSVEGIDTSVNSRPKAKAKAAKKKVAKPAAKPKGPTPPRSSKAGSDSKSSSPKTPSSSSSSTSSQEPSACELTARASHCAGKI